MGKHVQSALLCLTVAGMALLAAGCGGGLTTTGDQQTAQVETITVGAGSALQFNGKLVADETVRVYSKISGRVAEVHVEEGSEVKRGDILVQLDTSDLTLQYNQAQASLEAARAKLADVTAGAREQEVRAAQSAVDQAKALADQTSAAYDLAQKRFNQLHNDYDNGLKSEDDLEQGKLDLEKAKTGYDQAKAQWESAQSKLELLKAGATANAINALEAEVKRAEAAVELARHALEEAAVKSPIDGVVAKRSINPGEMAFTNTSTATVLLTLVKIDRVQVEASVPENQISNVQEGAAANVIVPALPGRTFQGQVHYISPAADDSGASFPIKLVIPNPDGVLRAGMGVQVVFDGSESSHLELPRESVVNKDGQTVVYRVENGVLQEIVVNTEEKNNNWVYVINKTDLQAGDRVVVRPTADLKDGDRVQVR